MEKNILLTLCLLICTPAIAQQSGCDCLKLEAIHPEQINFNDSLQINIKLKNLCNKDVLIYRDYFYYSIYDSAKLEKVKVKSIYERMYRTEIEPILVKADSQILVSLKYYAPSYYYDILNSKNYTLIVGYFKAGIRMKSLRKKFKNFYLYTCDKIISERRIFSYVN